MVIGSTLGSSPGAQPLVRFSDVSKRFAGHVAVDALSLDIMPGEFFALLGPSGCGKTTLLRMLGGFETPDDGAITLEGNDIVPVPPHRRPVNMMFQNYALFPHLSVERNVAFGLRQEGLPRGEIAARVHDMLALVQIDAFARRKPHQLSGGQRQRVALARALVKRPKVFLLDEPLAALDKKLRSQTQLELKQLQRRLGLTFVIVTHDQEEAMTMADRIGVMNRGRLIQIGTPAEIYEHPNSRWVAEFIGEVNLFDGRVAEKDSAAFLVIGNGARLRIAETGGAANGQAVAVAIRPEHIAIVRDRPLSPGNCLEGTIDEIAYRGDMSAYNVRLDDGTPLRVARPNLRQGAAGELAVGERVFLSFDADACITLTQ